MKLYQRKDRIRYLMGIITVITLAVLGILFAVKMKLGKGVTVPLRTGRYVAEDGMSWLVIEEEEKFYLVGNIAVSYAPRGNYIIDEDKLILQVNRDSANTFVFKIQGEQLIFESGDIVGDFIKKDRVFIYDTEGTFNKSYGLQQFEEAMKEKKYDFEMTDAEQFFLPTTRKRIVLDDEAIDIYLFTSDSIAEQESAYIDSGGCSYYNGTEGINVSWVSYPHFYRKGSIIVQYVGEDETIISDLEDILGDQFAGYRG